MRVHEPSPEERIRSVVRPSLLEDQHFTPRGRRGAAGVSGGSAVS